MACVLLVEDDIDLRFSLAGTLKRAGHQVVEADDGERGLALIEGSKPDIVISDMVMAGMEGIATVLTLRKSHRRLPILAISGNPLYLSNAEKLGATASLLKPFSEQSFIETIDSLIGQSQ